MRKTLLSMSIIAATALVGCDDKTKYVDVTEYIDKGLAEITDEQAGENCEFGGKKVIQGIDADDSDFLDGPELDAITTTYVCSEYEEITVVVINTIDATQEQIDKAVQNAVAPYLILQDDLDTANANLLTAQDAVDALEIQLAQVEEDLDDKTFEATWLEDTLISAGEFISEVQDDLITANDIIYELQQIKTALEVDLLAAQTTLDDHDTELIAIKAEITTLLINNGMTPAQADIIATNIEMMTNDEIAALIVAGYLVTPTTVPDVPVLPTLAAGSVFVEDCKTHGNVATNPKGDFIVNTEYQSSVYFVRIDESTSYFEHGLYLYSDDFCNNLLTPNSQEIYYADIYWDISDRAGNRVFNIIYGNVYFAYDFYSDEEAGTIDVHIFPLIGEMNLAPGSTPLNYSPRSI